MTTKILAAWAIVFVGLACTHADHVAPAGGSPAVVPTLPSTAAPVAPSPHPRPDDAKAPSPAIVPLAVGKRLRLNGVGGTDPDRPGDDPPPLEITVPPKFTVKMHKSEEELPSAQIRGAKLDIFVEMPEAGFTTLAEEEASLGGATFIHADETEDGYLLVYRGAVPGIGPRFGVLVSRPRLKVHCGAAHLAELAQAERVASICLTLRAWPGEPGP